MLHGARDAAGMWPWFHAEPEATHLAQEQALLVFTHIYTSLSFCGSRSKWFM